jgi:hypothetical protein
VRLGVLLPALLLSSPAFAQGRIAGTVAFKGGSPAPVPVKNTDPACKGAVVTSERRVLVRITGNPPRAPAPSAPVVVELKGCTYRPSLQGAVRGQKLLFRNADGTTHSLRAEAGGQMLFNVIQAAGSKDLLKDPLVTGVVKLGCDLHPWMKAFVVVSDHPFFTVTAEDGSFALEDVPAGTWRVEAWNERLGAIHAEVVVENGKSADPKFSFTVR